jgi:uncharacterized membrane protein HdeD (DUF308 family)
MRILLNITAALVFLMGVVWFLQGVNVLPGSFMTGQIEWSVYGALAVFAAAALFRYANRRRPDDQSRV